MIADRLAEMLDDTLLRVLQRFRRRRTKPLENIECHLRVEDVLRQSLER